jgi:hypothetical protein
MPKPDAVLALVIAQEVERLMAIEDTEGRREETEAVIGRMRGPKAFVESIRPIQADPVVQEFLDWLVAMAATGQLTD